MSFGRSSLKPRLTELKVIEESIFWFKIPEIISNNFMFTYKVKNQTKKIGDIDEVSIFTKYTSAVGVSILAAL